MSASAGAGLSANHLRWTVPRFSRTFAVRVVEPRQYEPRLHARIFEQVIAALINPAPLPPDMVEPGLMRSGAPFDLLTFPEAFAPAASLVAVLDALRQVPEFGCIHVGLRPDADLETHLFSAAAIHRLLDEIAPLSDRSDEDLATFRAWLSGQGAAHRFNLGCLFTKDMAGDLRICLHPKQVRSRYEHSALAERHLTEADLVTLVTLDPADNHFLSVTLQPLICSDALNLRTDRMRPTPMGALGGHGNPFAPPPDHVDIVSVATCTPQVPVVRGHGHPDGREWHGDFRDSFCHAASGGDRPRHHFATFVLANFETIPKDQPAGLSGLFQPIDPRAGQLHRAVDVAGYGRENSKSRPLPNNEWASIAEARDRDMLWRGYIAALKPLARREASAVRILGFELPNLLRDASPWKGTPGPSNCEVLVGQWDAADRLGFEDWRDDIHG